MKFPNKVIENAYHKAKNHSFNVRHHVQKYVDENGNDHYDYWAMEWLFAQGILDRKLDRNTFVFVYNLVK